MELGMKRVQISNFTYHPVSSQRYTAYLVKSNSSVSAVNFPSRSNRRELRRLSQQPFRFV